ncbi:probable ribose-5-phosphate isomerase 4, chloroplastic isoform X1 [Actinidia eriantha]|uniref:probable ribose-5-phosphate isomerase 4, chloroplastic isoform X1 n=2 Tax=Actinidia eriantha TaxID=165200 RepID=UPI0025911306|nr:probable ribose-5-phosphate isomerase 4, chloroplastic isoform X1 [Actinidia eriantha]
MAVAVTAAVMPSISTQNLHFQANHKKGSSFGLGFQTRRLNSLLSIPRSSLLDSSSAYLLEFAAKSTVDTFIKSGMVVGLGSGLASHMAIQYLGRQLRLGTIKDIVGIPTSVSSASEAVDAGIPLDHYQDSSQIDFAFSDADIIEEGTLISVIGRQRLQGEESIIQEKTILKAAEKLAFIVTEKQYKGVLYGSIPVLVKSFNWMETAEEIDDLFLVEAEVWRRPSIGHAGPLGGDFPLITREGHNVLDLIFTSPILNLAEVAKCLDDIDGVVDHGVISKIPCVAVVASEDGLSIVENPPKDAESGY